MTSSQDEIRRLRVASLHLRGLTPLEISSALGPDMPADVETVCEDIAYLERIWTTEVKPTPRHLARMLAETREARRVAWAKADMGLVLELIKQEAKLLRIDTLLL